MISKRLLAVCLLLSMLSLVDKGRGDPVMVLHFCNEKIHSREHWSENFTP